MTRYAMSTYDFHKQSLESLSEDELHTLAEAKKGCNHMPWYRLANNSGCSPVTNSANTTSQSDSASKTHQPSN